MNHSTSTTAQLSDTRNLVAACAAISVFGFAFGMTYPLLSLILETRGVSSDVIGINSAMMPIGILLFSSVIPLAANRYGSRKVAIVAALTTGFLLLGYKVFDNLNAWFVIRLIQGMSVSTLFVLSEAWIIGSTGDKNRGKIVAVYSSILSASFGAGPLLISFIGIDGWLPFVFGSSVVFLGVIPLLFVNDEKFMAEKETKPSSIRNFAPKAPVLLACVAVFAIFDAATLSFIPVYGMKLGMDIPTSANLLTALILGNVLLQLPIGWLADKFPHRWILAGCASITSACLLILPLAINSALKWPLLIIIGTAGYGVYTISLTSLGDRFRGNELVSGSAAFALMWGFGALIGSVSGGWSMLGFGPQGLPLSLSLLFFCLLLALIGRAITDRHRNTNTPLT